MDFDLQFRHSGNMESIVAAHAFSTLGHPGRLAVFRLLMRFAPQGVRPTEMTAALGFRPNTLSHHLSDLAAANLIRVERRGRSLYYTVALDAAEELIGYLALDVARARPDLLGPLHAARRELGNLNGNVHVLFLCSANSARSIFAEVLLRDLGKGRFRVDSAGTRPAVAVNPLTLRTLAQRGHDTAGLRSKHISDFRGPGARAFDVVVTVCDTAAAEECPPWPGGPITGHWGVPDPALATGTEDDRAQVFDRTYEILRRRINAFVDLPFDGMSATALQRHVDALGSHHLSLQKG